MSLGFVMLVHSDFDRAAQVARYWASNGCPVVVHVDRKARPRDVRAFRAMLDGQADIAFCRRHRVEWGTWSLVQATRAGARRMLDAFPQVRHVFLASGSCLPLRPVAELRAYLDANPDTDFIESVTIDEVAWTIDGLEAERFTLRFPFAWRTRRRLFDRYVALQRRLRLRRRVPDGLTPHLGSQWWCLTRRTLSSILDAPDRAALDRYFSKVWIPDESYFQTLARRHATDIESRSLTLSKFDVHGRPHVFYDDHLQLLDRSDCFVARKIWPRAQVLYDTFLNAQPDAPRRAEPNPGKIDRVFGRANVRREQGRPGLYSQARFPDWGRENGLTSARYQIFWGFDDLYPSFQAWLSRRIGGRVHGHLYDPEAVRFAGGETVVNGCLSDSATLRDYRPEQFLTNLIWNTRGERQTFLHGPADRQEAVGLMLRDPNATIAVVSGAWTVPLHLSNEPFETKRARAAELQRTEMGFLRATRATGVAARVQVWSLAEFLAQPLEKTQNLLDEINGPGPRRPIALPERRDVTALPAFLQSLRNGGLKPVVTGDLDILREAVAPATKAATTGAAMGTGADD